MANIICQHNDRYNLYSTISDGFIYSSSLSSDQVHEYIKVEHGQAGLQSLPKRLERAGKYGSSSLLHTSLDDFLCVNRAGKDEEHLSTKECIKRFLS